MPIQRNLSIFALRQYLPKVGLKTEVMATDHLSEGARRDGSRRSEGCFASLGEMNQIIIHEKNKNEESIIIYNYRFIAILFVHVKQIKNTLNSK